MQRGQRTFADCAYSICVRSPVYDSWSLEVLFDVITTSFFESWRATSEDRIQFTCRGLPNHSPGTLPSNQQEQVLVCGIVKLRC